VTITLFGDALRHRAGDEALECDGRTYTFGEIDRRRARMANVLAARGLGPGDRLAVYLENRVEFIDLFLACLSLGVIVVPINVLYREREVGHILADAEPKAVVAAGPVPGGAAYWDVEELVREIGHDPGAEAPGLQRDAPAAIIYTSGTTGVAKGAVLARGNFAANAQALVQAWRFTSADRLLLPLPLFHVHGLGNGLGCWLASGCRLRVLPRFDAQTIGLELQEFRPTVMFGVPTIYVRMLADEVITREDAASVGRAMRLFVSGSAPLPAETFVAFRAKFGHDILERYGMTETFMNVSNPYDGERRPGTVGLPLPGVSVRLITPDGGEAAAGEDGELWIRGPSVFGGYWRRPEATAAAFSDGWFRTGDIGRRAADGYISLCGRMSDVIISGGFNIYPREIEEALLAHPGVREAAVVGAPDPIRGEVPVAYIVAAPEVDDEALRDGLRRALASFKLPRAFIRVNALPRTALGKIQKHLLPPWTR
jgi:malonyl-CoA/methylmalonyl-CoA synthetase